MSDEFSAQESMVALPAKTADGYEVRPWELVWYPINGGAVQAQVGIDGKHVLVPQHRERPVSEAYSDSQKAIEAIQHQAESPKIDKREVSLAMDALISLARQKERQEIIDGLHPRPPGQWTECMRTGFQEGVNKLKELIRARPL